MLKEKAGLEVQMSNINLYVTRLNLVLALICPILVYLFPDYFYVIFAFQVFIFIVALVNAYYLRKKYLEKQKAHNERFGDLADRMNKLFGEDWSNLK